MISLLTNVHIAPVSRCYSVAQISRRNCLRSPWRIAHEAFAHCKAARSRICRAVIVVLVDDRMDHDCLFVNCNCAVRRDCDPIVCRSLHQYSERGIKIQCVDVEYKPLTSLKRQRFTSHEHDVGSFISPLHLVLPRSFTLLPARTGGEVQRSSFIGGTAHISRTHDAMTIGNGEVQKTPLVHHFVPQLGWGGIYKGIDELDRLKHCLPEHRVPETIHRALLTIGVKACFLQTVEEESKSPFAVSVSLNNHEPFLSHAQCDFSLDMSPAGNVAVVHEHETAVGERVAVRIGKAALGGSAYMGEDQRGCGFRGETGEIDAVPSGRRAGEDAGVGSEDWRSVVANAEAVAVVRPAVVLECGKCHSLRLL